MATRVTNKGRAAIALPAPYSATVKGGGHTTLDAAITVVADTLARSLPFSQLSALQLSLTSSSDAPPATISAVPAATAATFAAVAVTTPSAAYKTAPSIYQTRITNLTGSAQDLPAPYSSTVLAYGNVVVTDPVAVVAANLAKMPEWQQPFWQVSVAEPSPSTVPASGPFDLNGQRAINAADPINLQDLTTKSYVDAAVAAVEVTSVTMGADVSGKSDAATVVALRGRSLDNTPPVPGQVLGWNGVAWLPVDQTGGGGTANTRDVVTMEELFVGDCAVLKASGAQRANPLDHTKMPALGVVIAVASPTEATLQFSGSTAAVFSHLLTGERYFVGNNGRLSTTLPTGAALVQPVGLALSANELLVLPTLNLTQRSS